jgi:hypothetical protein
MDFDRILPNVLVGSHPTTDDDVDTLADAGITAVLNLQSEDDFNYLGIEWPLLQTSYGARRIDVRRVPIQDFDDDDLRDNLPNAAATLAELVAAGCTVYVHCSAGVNRSPSVVIAYLHWLEGWSLDDAAAHVRERRPCHPVLEAIRDATWDKDS